MNRDKIAIAIMVLLREEVECLRSVLSEWEEDKSAYSQMIRADILREAIETMEHKL